MYLYVCLFTGRKHDRTVRNSVPIVSALSGHGYWYVTLNIFYVKQKPRKHPSDYIVDRYIRTAPLVPSNETISRTPPGA